MRRGDCFRTSWRRGVERGEALRVVVRSEGRRLFSTVTARGRDTEGEGRGGRAVPATGGCEECDVGWCLCRWEFQTRDL